MTNDGFKLSMSGGCGLEKKIIPISGSGCVCVCVGGGGLSMHVCLRVHMVRV